MLQALFGKIHLFNEKLKKSSCVTFLREHLWLIDKCGLCMYNIFYLFKISQCSLYSGALNSPKITVHTLLFHCLLVKGWANLDSNHSPNCFGCFPNLTADRSLDHVYAPYGPKPWNIVSAQKRGSNFIVNTIKKRKQISCSLHKHNF